MHTCQPSTPMVRQEVGSWKPAGGASLVYALVNKTPVFNKGLLGCGMAGHFGPWGNAEPLPMLSALSALGDCPKAKLPCAAQPTLPA